MRVFRDTIDPIDLLELCYARAERAAQTEDGTGSGGHRDESRHGGGPRVLHGPMVGWVGDAIKPGGAHANFRREIKIIKS